MSHDTEASLAVSTVTPPASLSGTTRRLGACSPTDHACQGRGRPGSKDKVRPLDITVDKSSTSRRHERLLMCRSVKPQISSFAIGSLGHGPSNHQYWADSLPVIFKFWLPTKDRARSTSAQRAATEGIQQVERHRLAADLRPGPTSSDARRWHSRGPESALYK